jgi:hypothetical protein
VYNIYVNKRKEKRGIIMPTRDYDPINELIEAIHNTSIHTWPTIKATTDTKGNIFISPGSTDDYTTINPKSAHTTKKEPVDPFAIRSVLSNHKKNAFSVVWMDGTTTVVHCQAGDEWDDEKALAMCFTKKALGNKGNFNDKFNDALDNKMKVIKGEKEVVKEVVDMWKETLRSPINGQLEIANDIPTKEEVHEIVQEALAKVAKPAEKAARSMTDMINALTDTAESSVPTYRLFVKDTRSIVPAGSFSRKAQVVGRAKELAKELYGSDPFYYRLWDEEGRLMVDFGSYTKFLVLEGIEVSDWYKY